VKPIHYSIRITPNFSDFIFEGVVSIKIETNDLVNKVILNARDLELKHSFLLQDDIERECQFTLNADQQEVAIELPESLQGEILLRIEYSGLINNQYAGFYRSKYTQNGQEKYIASTQFEAKDARRAFPCFDQPDKKATFDIEYEIDTSLTGISNTEIIEEKILSSGKKLVRFAPTPKMSTYLVFFGIGEFEFIEDASEEPLVRVATTSGKTEYGYFALDMARKSLRFGADYTGVPFPMPKCDYIAIPDSMGAMENFGAIRHCEDDLLVYPDTTSKARATLTAKIIAHEGIHMWFGDLVSPAAWKYLWLNEAFATYFTYVIPHHFYPEWGVWEQFFQERLLTGMERDSLLGTVPIDLPYVDDPDADPAPTPSTGPIIYNKGAAVLRMLAAYLGESRFRQAVHDFLTEYQFESASSEQFWKTVSRSTGISLEEFAETWIYQPGYPLISVKREGDTLMLTQTRFAYDPGLAPVSRWVIPVDILCFFEDGGTKTLQVLLNQSSKAIQLPENVIAYKLNSDFTGFYRVHYSQDNLKYLGELIRSQELSAIDSLNVLSDFFALVKAGAYSVDEYLHYVEIYLTKENRYLALTDLTKSLSHLYRISRSKRAIISRLGNVIFEQALDAIGYLPAKDESLLVSELRTTLLETAFLLGSNAVAEFGRTQFQALVDEKLVHRDILSVILKIGAAVHPQAGDWLKARAGDVSLPEGERARALEALGNQYQDEALSDALKMNMEKIPSSLRHHMLGAASLNPSAFDWMWDWYVKNLTQMESEIPLSYVQAITVRLAPLSGIGRRQEVENFLQAFIARHPTVADSIAMALELLVVNEKIN
jgi:aminopeptidase N